jgi:hypothetical protein
VRPRSQDILKLLTESVAFGFGYCALLIWLGSALVGSFALDYGSLPYWPAVPQLRTDTAGAISFAVAAVSLSVSQYLCLRRRRSADAPPEGAGSAGVLALQAVAETAAVLGSGLVSYLSLNAVTHPSTLQLQLTHLLPGPSEGTVRVIALIICLAATALARFLRASYGGGHRARPYGSTAW